MNTWAGSGCVMCMLAVLITGCDESADVAVPSEHATGAVVTFDEAHFDTQIADGVVLVDFWATWCVPCRLQAPIIEELAKQYAGKATFGKLDVDEAPKILMRYDIMGPPVVMIFKDGELVNRHVGVTEADTLSAELDKALRS